MSEFIDLFNTIYNLSPIPLRMAYGFWAALMIMYWYAYIHDRYNVPKKDRELDERNFTAALPFIGVANVLLYWFAEHKKFPWHIPNLLPQEVAAVGGFFVMVIGLYVTLMGRAAINGYWGPHLYIYKKEEDRKIIRHGIYSKIRHPIYFGQVLMASGTFLLANTPTFLIFPAAVAIWNTVRAKKETKFLIAQYKNEFQDYRKKTPYRVIPGLL